MKNLIIMKNLLKFTIISATIFFSNYTQAQSETDEIRNNESFKIITEKYTNYHTSEEYIKNEKIINDFLANVPEEYFDSEENTSEFDIWIKNNISKSRFSSIEEAITHHKNYQILFENRQNAQKKLLEEYKVVKEQFENKELFDKIFFEEWNDMMTERLITSN